jgi:hypothetical protein
VTDAIPFYEAKSYLRGFVRTEVRWIVIHCMQNAEKPTQAEDTCKWLAGMNPQYPPPDKVSCHYFFDALHTAQGVREDHIAYHAPGANKLGIGLEHAGRAEQTRAEWLDEAYGVPMLKRSAAKAAEIAQRWHVPVNFVGPTELRAGMPGFTTHAAVTKAWPEKSHGHMDPGPGFAMDWYLHEVGLVIATLPPLVIAHA